MLMLIRLRIMFSTVTASPSACRISNSSVKLCPKWITPQTLPFLPASNAVDTLSYGTYIKEGNHPRYYLAYNQPPAKRKQHDTCTMLSLMYRR